MVRHLSPPENAPAESTARKRIVAAARQHFFAHGFRGVTMDDLAAELGMSKKTLYACFPSKTALLEAVFLDKFRNVAADLDRITAAGSTDFPATLHEFLACLHRHTDEIRPPFLRDLQREAPEMFHLVERRRRQLIQRSWDKLLSDGRRAGIIRKDISTKMIIEILLGAVQAIMNPPKMAELGLTPRTGLATIVTVILEGVITAEGRSKS